MLPVVVQLVVDLDPAMIDFPPLNMLVPYYRHNTLNPPAELFLGALVHGVPFEPSVHW